MDNYCVKAELHCHVKSNKLGYFPILYDAVQTVEEIVDECVKKGIKILSITDHDNFENNLRAREYIKHKDYEILYVNGEEVSSKDGHVLAYGIKEKVEAGQTTKETIERIYNQGGIAVASHPFNYFFSLKDKIEENYFEVVEIFNASSSAMANQKAKEYVEKNKLSGIAGSDAHSKEGLGRGITVFKEGVKNVGDVLEAIKNKDFRIEGEYYSWAKIFWNNIKGNLFTGI